MSGSNIAYDIAYREANVNAQWIRSSNFQSGRTINVPFGKTYEVRVRARKSNTTQGIWSDSGTVTNTNTALSALSAPQNLQISNKTDNSFTVSWSSVTDATAYTIKYYTGTTSVNRSPLVTENVGTNTRYNVTNINLDQTSYYFEVKAYSTVGDRNSEYNGVVVTQLISAPTSAPGAIRGLSATRSGNVINLQWNSTNDAESYDIEYRRIDGNSVYNWSDTTISRTNFAIEGDSSVVAVFRVRAKNSVGSGPWSDFVSDRSDVVLAIPQNLNVSLVSDSDSATVSWRSVDGSNVVYDIIYREANVDASWSRESDFQSGDAITVPFGKTYEVRVRARKSNTTQGIWSESDNVTNTNTPGSDDPPEEGGDDGEEPEDIQRVSNIRTTNITSSSISLSWDSQTNVTYDVWYCVRLDCPTWIESTSALNERTFDGLNSGTEYAFIVRAKRGSTIGEWPVEISYFSTQADNQVPPMVQGVSYRVISGTEINVIWSNVPNATSYDIGYVESGGSNWQYLQASNVSVRIPNLLSGTNYLVSVRANNNNGAGEWSVAIQATTSGTVTTSVPQVTGLRSTRINDTSVDLIWNPLAGVQYEVRYTSTSNSMPTVMPSPQGFTTVRCLVPSTQYFFEVRAINSNAETGPWSETVPATTAPRGQSPDFSVSVNPTGTACPTDPVGPQPPTGQPQTQLRDGDIVRVPNTYDVYILKMINGKQFKRLILNPQIFDSYGHLRWENIKDITQQTLNSFTTSNLVREVYADGRPG